MIDAGPFSVMSPDEFAKVARAKVVFAFTKQDCHWPKAA